MPVAGLCTGFVERKDWLRPRLRPVGADRAALEALTLNDIDHRTLNPIWHDPGVHAGLNSASIRDPNPALEAFTPKQRATLRAAARNHVNDPRGVHIDQRLSGLTASKVHIWFLKDVGCEIGVITQLLRYAERAFAVRIRARQKFADYRYGWALDDAR